jgi:dihydrofolate reductase
LIVSLIVAVDEKGGIGKNNAVPWHLPADLRRFKRLTMGHHLVMGRKTFESIGRPLPGRITVVITHRETYLAPGAQVVHSLAQALRLAKKNSEDEVFVVGGGEIFSQAIHLAEKIYMTIVHIDAGAEVKFPELNPDEWECTSCVHDQPDGQHQLNSDFKILVRKPPARD